MEGVLGWLGSVLLLSVLVSSSLFFSFRAHHELGAVHLSAEILVMATKAASFFFGGRIEVGYCPFRYLYCAVIGSDFLASFPSFHKTDDILIEVSNKDKHTLLHACIWTRSSHLILIQCLPTFDCVRVHSSYTVVLVFCEARPFFLDTCVCSQQRVNKGFPSSIHKPSSHSIFLWHMLHAVFLYFDILYIYIYKRTPTLSQVIPLVLARSFLLEN
jgi:hypothetical protein